MPRVFFNSEVPTTPNAKVYHAVVRDGRVVVKLRDGRAVAKKGEIESANDRTPRRLYRRANLLQSVFVRKQLFDGAASVVSFGELDRLEVRRKRTRYAGWAKDLDNIRSDFRAFEVAITDASTGILNDVRTKE